MNIEINNREHLKVFIDKDRNTIIIEKYNVCNQVESTRKISETEFVDLYNILIYAQDHKIDIFRLWEAK